MIHIKVGETLIETTEGHPFWVVGYGFKYSHDLEVGDHAITAEGIEAEITFVKTVEVEPTKTYNFEVEDWHTYFVSDARIWVHNDSGTCDKIIKQLNKEGNGTTNLFRSMSQAEYNSVMQNKKFIPYDFAMEDKWFATTYENATKWGNIFYPDGKYRFLEVEVNANSLNKMYHVDHLDNIGPAYCATLDVLEESICSIKRVK